MKQKFLIVVMTLAVLAVTACGGADATPEISAEDIASTAIAQAWLALTQTAAAVPTSTPVPPTFTPQPINTLPPTLALLPTLPPATISVAVSPTPECNQIPQPEPKGALANVEFYNESTGSVNLAFGMLSPNDKGECYTYSFSINSGKTLSAKVLAGCYWGWAWINGADGSIAKSGDKVLCLTDPVFIHKIVITAERVDFK
jgi:hypothetical protein